MNCANCEYNDGMVYTSLPPQYRCTITDKFHHGDDECDAVLNEERSGEVYFPMWMYEGIRDGEYSKIECHGTEYIKLKHGHWVHDWDIGCSSCSVCDDSFLWEDFNGVGEFNYCPTCGAKMDEVEDGK